MKTIVIDANIAIKWLFEEPYREESHQYLQKTYHRIAPDFLLLEAISAAHKKVIMGLISEEEGIDSLRLLERKGLLHFIPTDEYWERAYTNSSRRVRLSISCFSRTGKYISHHSRSDFFRKSKRKQFRTFNILDWI